MKALLFILTMFLTTLTSGQTTTVQNGDWSNDNNWTNGTPSESDIATIENQLLLDENLEIKNKGVYSLASGSITDELGGNKFKIKIKDQGSFLVNGNISIEGEFKIEDKGELVVEASDTIRIGKKFELKDDARLTIKEFAVVIVDGDFKLKDDVLAIIDGKVFVSGKVEAKNNAIVTGSGNLESQEKMETKNASQIYGSSSDCNPGPCEYGNGEGLPIVLKEISADFIHQESIRINWVTVAEINNDHFTLSYSIDGINFKEVETIQGAGNSNHILSYTTTLNEIDEPIVYIKLKQTDFDGRFEEFTPLVVKRRLSLEPNQIGLNDKIEDEQVTLYPNPGDGNSIFAEFKNFKANNYQISIHDNSGRQLINQPVIIEEGTNYAEFELLHGLVLNKGLHFVRIGSLENVITKQYIVY